MKIADMDSETRAVIVLAHIVADRPTEENLGRLRAKLKEFDTKHEQERTENLLRFLFAPEVDELCG